MCGIYGIVYFGGTGKPAGAALEKMAAATVHRGPDDEGEFFDGPCSMGMRRLSIIDVDGGHQPLTNEDGTVSVVCNGEIYNFRELRGDLESRGHVFSTGSDAEVLVHLYEENGDSFIEKLRGMFGFALWDSRRQRLLLGRDRLGIKPLYIAQQERSLVFASEMKAILAVPGTDRNLDRTALSEYLALGYVPAPLSIFDGIKKLGPGAMLIFESGQVSIREYWRPEAREKDDLTENDWIDRLRQTLASSVERQLVSDVPLGAFLSGGLDSSSIVAMMSASGAQPIKTYAIGFDDGAAGAYYNELPYAKAVADQFGSDHKEIIVQPDVAQLLPRLLWHLDEPVADSAFLTTFLVAEFARKDVKVILSGAGGDELCGGYRRYLGSHYADIYNRIPSQLRKKLIGPIARKLPGDRHSGMLNLFRLAKAFVLNNDLPPEERYRAYVGVFDNAGIRQLLGDEKPATNIDSLVSAYDGLGTDDLVQQCMLVDLKTQLPDDILMLTDRMTMAASLECRVPFLDEDMVDLSLSMPADMKVNGRTLKYALKKSMEGTLQKSIIHRGKRGFGAPMGAWLKGSLLSMTKYFLSEDSVEERGLLSPMAVKALVDSHVNDIDDHTDRILGLLNLEIWSRIFLDGKTPEEISDHIRENTRQ